MPRVKSAQEIAEKWARVTPQRSEDYRRGVENPRVDWAAATAAAKDRYVAGIQQAIQAGRMEQGVKRAGTAKWAAKAAQLGPQRYAEGVSMAAPDYEQGWAPYREIIERIKLPERFAKGDPRNWERSKALGMALYKAKMGS